MSSEDLGKIKERITKLLRMADDASSPNEAAIAASRARKLMDKYQLDMLDIGNSFDEDFSEQAATRVFAAVPQYLSIFAVAVGKYNDVQAVFNWGDVTHKMGAKKGKGQATKSRGRYIEFRGYASDVQLAVDMLKTLEEAVNRLCKNYLSEKGYSTYPVKIGGQFKTAAILTLSDRLSEMTVERDKIASTAGTSLVLLKSKSVDERFGEIKYVDKKTNLLGDSESNDAQIAGYKAGHSVEIVRSVETD